MHTGVAAVVFMSDNSKQGHVWPDAKEGASSKEARHVSTIGKELS